MTKKPTTKSGPNTRPKCAKRRKSGPPTRVIDLQQVFRLGLIDCTIDEIAAVLGFNKSHFIDRMNADPAIAEAIGRGKEHGKMSLRRRQHRKAMSGSDTMLIWAGKQRLGQRDRFDVDHGVTKSLEELLRAVGKSIPESS